MPRVLFVNPNFDDFLSDGLFHGLRRLLGEDAVDFPRIDHLYADARANWRRRLHGRGFTLAGLLDDLPVERNRSLARAAKGEFDAVVFTDIWRTFGLWTEWAPVLAEQRRQLVVIDGSDRVEPFPYAGKWWRDPSWWTLPRIEPRAMHFKREITPWAWWFASYLRLAAEAWRAGSAGCAGSGRSRSRFPPRRSSKSPPSSRRTGRRMWSTRRSPQRVGGRTSYAFEDAAEYHADLRASRFGITVKRAGWDALRHYEIAANGAVPCFRGLDRKPPLCAPHGLVDGVNTIVYRDADELERRVSTLDEAGYRALQAGALAWARANTTEVRARWFLEAIGLTPP